MCESIPNQTQKIKPTTMSIKTGILQRACACGQHAANSGGECEECKRKRQGMLQRSATSTASISEVPPIVHEVLRSSGQPLDVATCAFIEPHFGHSFSNVPVHSISSHASEISLKIGLTDDRYEHEANRMSNMVMRQGNFDSAMQPEQQAKYDFSNVRVHTDALAAKSADKVNALAYTVGNNVVFGAGQYAPNTNVGRQLLAHELTHVAQQSIHPQSLMTLQRQQRPQTTVTLASEGLCTNPRAIAEAIPGAMAMAWTAVTWFLSFSPSDMARVSLLLRANFLSDSADTRDIVKNRLLSIHRFLQAAQSGQVTFVCAPTNDSECGNREGYVLDMERNRIHICPPFFNLTLEGRRWMLIHECAHLAGAIKLPEYYWGFFGEIGESQCQQLTPMSSTNDALGNADNYARLAWCLTRQPGITVTPT
jgi:uncharacterized protein DUF4157/lysine-specific metallo-endopeptidase family protein